MDNRPIGFFDSGLGGLTCIPYVLDALPDESIVYFGDTARTPYGSKAVSTIRGFAFEIADFLVCSGVKMIAIACNTVSATCLDELRTRHPEIPILGIITPAARTAALELPADGRIGIIGTKATITSGAYRKAIEQYTSGAEIFETACPAFVPLIEEGIIENEIMDLTIRYYLDHFISYNKIETLVLGCTHYPLIRRNITRVYPQLSIIDPSRELLTSIRAELANRELLADLSGMTPPENIFYASDLSENFVNMISRILAGSDAKASFRTISLEKK
ncbi:MAG: glutamate racemase [Clostridiales Family XIII bacterium]|jgi:glutamate racemase|nr:glutamate racemase [Clostridiales Family XIII bacterium]